MIATSLLIFVAALTLGPAFLLIQNLGVSRGNTEAWTDPAITLAAMAAATGSALALLLIGLLNSTC